MIYYVWYSKKYSWCYSAEGWDFYKTGYKSCKKAIKHLLGNRYCGSEANFKIRILL